MTKLASVVFAAALIASSANSQTAQSGSESASSSQALVYQEAGTIPRQAPGVSAPGMMHTGPCIVSTSGAVSGPGIGVALGGGRLDEACDIRAGAAALSSVVGNRAAAEHLCLDPRMQSTLEPMGLCTIHRRQTANRPKTSTAYRSCVFEEPTPESPGGVIRLSVRFGAQREVAIEQCRAALGK